jgi:hypothetical protein
MSAAERVARIRRIRDHAAVAQDRRSLPDESRLRVGGMNVEELAPCAKTSAREGPTLRAGIIIAADSNPGYN